MSQGTAPPDQREQGVWLSLPALFSDGDRDVVCDEAACSDAQSCHSEASELSAMRMDISDIQEAIKNHDLWVQDAAAMRGDIDELQAAIKEHETWMGHLSTALRHIQEREARFEIDIADFRRRLFPSADGHPSASTKASVALRRDNSRGDGLNNEGHADARGSIASRRTVAEGPAGLERVEMGLTQQLNQGLRILRTMVTAVEGSLSRQLDSERAARRAALADLRQEFAQGLVPPSWVAPEAGETSQSPLAPPPDSPIKTLSLFQQDDMMKLYREANCNVDAKALVEDCVAETQTALNELRTEIAALRAEQQLQAAAAGALALASGHFSPHARLRSIKALEERVLASQTAAVQKKQFEALESGPLREPPFFEADADFLALTSASSQKPTADSGDDRVNGERREITGNGTREDSDDDLARLNVGRSGGSSDKGSQNTIPTPAVAEHPGGRRDNEPWLSRQEGLSDRADGDPDKQSIEPTAHEGSLRFQATLPCAVAT